MTSVTFENAVAVLGLLGIGGVVGTYLRILWERIERNYRNKNLRKHAVVHYPTYVCYIRF